MFMTFAANPTGISRAFRDATLPSHPPGALKKKWYLDDITDWLPTDTNSHWDFVSDYCRGKWMKMVPAGYVKLVLENGHV